MGAETNQPPQEGKLEQGAYVGLWIRVLPATIDAILLGIFNVAVPGAAAVSARPHTALWAVDVADGDPIRAVLRG
jgi:hypothetical protein